MTCSCFLLSIFQLPHSKRYPKTQKKRLASCSNKPLQTKNPLILSHFSILSPNRTKIPMASIIDSRPCAATLLLGLFTPGKNIYPLPKTDLSHRVRHSTNCAFRLIMRGIRYKMISAERSAAFDSSAGICYNENTKGNTADRRSALRI